MKSVFYGDMCVGENTSRPANVRIVRPLADGECAAAGRSLFVGKVFDFVDDLGPAAAWAAAGFALFCMIFHGVGRLTGEVSLP